MSGKPLIGPAEYSSFTRQNAIEIWFLVRCYVLEGHDSALGERNYLARIRNTWRDVRIIKWIVERIPKVSPRRIWRIICGVVNVKPRLRRAAAHIAHNFSVRRTPRQPHGGS